MEEQRKYAILFAATLLSARKLLELDPYKPNMAKQVTLTQTLSIREKFLRYEDGRALEYCERKYREAGEPTERWQVINFLERMLQELKEQGGYPKILLLRKKEIQRRTYTIPQPGEEKPIGECSCADGWLSTGRPCPCSKGEPHRKQLRAWGMNV